MRKTIVAITAISLLVIGCYSVKKYQAAVAVMEKLTVLPKNIKDIKIGIDRIRFTFDLQLINHTEYDLGFTTGSVIGITRVKLFTENDVLLADINTDISTIELPAHSDYVLRDIVVEIPTHSMLSELDTIIAYLTQNKLHFEVTIKAFGKEFKIRT